MSPRRLALSASLLLACWLATPSWAQHEGHGMPAPSPTPSPRPRQAPAPRPTAAPVATPPAEQATQPNLVPQPGWPHPVMDHEPFSLLLFDQFEYVTSEGALDWDMVGWWGGDYNRLWLKSEGSTGAGGSTGDAELQALYGRLVTPYFDAQGGLRLDRVWRPGVGVSRAHAVVGLQGLAPFYSEVEPALFVSQSGDVSGRLTLSRSLPLTQRTFLQLKLETEAALQAVPAFGVGAGWNDLSLGLRLRHEIRREFAPYAGLTWTRRFGQTAQLAEQTGEPASLLSFVAGLRWWF